MVAHKSLTAFDTVAVDAGDFPELVDAQAVLLGGLARGNLYSLPLFLLLFFLLQEAILVVTAIGGLVLVVGTFFLSVRCGIEYGLTGGWLTGLLLAVGNVLAMALVVVAEIFLILGVLMLSPIVVPLALAGVAFAVWLVRRGDAAKERLLDAVAPPRPVATDEEE